MLLADNVLLSALSRDSSDNAFPSSCTNSSRQMQLEQSQSCSTLPFTTLLLRISLLSSCSPQ
jgi:hypothetical protein